jgi:hypothetical protein
MLRFVVHARRATRRYLGARGLRRPRVTWAEINAIKAQVQQATRGAGSRTARR